MTRTPADRAHLARYLSDREPNDPYQLHTLQLGELTEPSKGRKERKMLLYEIIINQLKKAAPDALMRSRKNCHALGLDSIVISVDENTGALTRMFISNPSGELSDGWDYAAPNPQTFGPMALNHFSVGVHEHKYPIRLQQVLGQARHIECAIVSPCDHACDDRGVWMHASMFGAFGESVEPIGMRLVRPIENRVIVDEYLPAEALHTVVADPRGAAWLAVEGAATKDKTICLSNEPLSKWDSSALYQRFQSPHEVIDYASVALNNIQRQQNSGFRMEQEASQ